MALEGERYVGESVGWGEELRERRMTETGSGRRVERERRW